MANWRQALTGAAADVEEHFDSLKSRFFTRLHSDKPIQIVPYIGFGTPENVYMRGRVLRDKGITRAADNDTIWANLANMYRRFNSDELPGVTVRATLGDIQQTLVTNDEGYFEAAFDLPQPLAGAQSWHPVEVELIDYPGVSPPPEVRATGRVLVPPMNAQFGVISDIDDTVLQTNVLNYLKMARNVFLRNAHTRLPFEGVAAFYQALQQGTQETFNPIFYLSKSPWNLFDLLVDFFEVRDIPLGPLLLTDMGLTPNQLLFPPSREYKLNNVRRLLDTYAHLPFILIGDSGEKDPEVYAQIAQEYPGRIPAIYIRDVTRARRDAKVIALRDRAAAVNTDLLLVADTGIAAEHAAQHGYIAESAIAQIMQERAQDLQAPRLLEELLGGDGE